MKKILAASAFLALVSGLCSGANPAAAASAGVCTAANGGACTFGHWIVFNNREAQTAQGPHDRVDEAQPLAAEYEDDAIAESLRDRLEQVGRALRRIDEGSWGRSVRSGVPIPPERLEADPAAEFTVAEAAEQERSARG